MAEQDEDGEALSVDEQARQVLIAVNETAVETDLRAVFVVVREPFSEPRLFYSVPKEDGDRVAHTVIEAARQLVTEQ